MPVCLIGLGSNQGDRRQTLERAVKHLAQREGVTVVGCSRWQETQAVGGPQGQSAFLNGVALLETSLAPESLLGALVDLESQSGRERGERWGPRTLDLDLLLYGEQVVELPNLVVPHPRMAWRRFVLEPAAEIAAGMVHPTIGWTIRQLLAHLNSTAPYVAVAGAVGAGKTELAVQIARRAGARLLAESFNVARLEEFYFDPSGEAWVIELEYLLERARLLAANSPNWSEPGWTVSDFWFDQSLAYARAWLPRERFAVFEDRFRGLAEGVARPKLVVAVEPPLDRLIEQVRRRARSAESILESKVIERIRRSVRQQLDSPDVGPVLWLTGDDRQNAIEEVLAAMDAMK